LAPTAARIGDVRLHLENTLGDAYEPTFGSRVSGALHAVGRFLSSTAARGAEAAPGRPKIISRAGWGANESWVGDGPGLASSEKMVFVHHTDNSNSYLKSESAALVRAIYRYHTQTRGYSDIAYNFLIDRYGQIFEGRHGGAANAVIGDRNVARARPAEDGGGQGGRHRPDPAEDIGGVLLLAEGDPAQRDDERAASVPRVEDGRSPHPCDRHDHDDQRRVEQVRGWSIGVVQPHQRSS